MGLVGTFLLALVKAIVLVWGTLTNWAYRIIHDSTEVVKAYSKVHWNGFTCMCLIAYQRCGQKRLRLYRKGTHL